MARIVPTSASHFIVSLLFLISYSITVVQVTGEVHHSFMKNLDRKLMGLKKEKLTQFRVYWHDIISGSNPTVIQVVKPPGNTPATFNFGSINMINDPLTEGPQLSSKMVGRAQGFYASASQQELALLVTMNFAFTDGKYNGSSITVLGRNVVFSKVREMPVIGGSGLFRFARGYVQAKTIKFNPNAGDVTVQYNVYVLHY